jgi:uncharacterized Zn finger protein|nr:MAG TPA: hypothetical protein [Caudoviricetes sp.]
MRIQNLADVLNLNMEQASKLSRAELAKVVQVGAAPLNKRIKNLGKYADYAPAVKGLERSGGAHFGTRGKNRNELLRELNRIQSFASKETASVAGAKSYKKFVQETAGAISGSEENKLARAKAYWDLYRKIESEMGVELNKDYGSSQLQTELREIEDLENVDVMDYVKQIYESLSDGYADRASVSDFFKPLD